MTLRILLADDHGLVRAGMVKLLEGLLGVEVIAQAGDGEEALAQAVQCQPDLMLLDIAMPKLNGLQVCERLSHMQPATKVVMLSMHREQQYVRKALQSGASGYLLKDAAPAELGVALQAVQDGKIYLSPALSQDMVAGVVQGLRTPQAQPLTPRQTEVLTLAAMGKSTKEIALKLGLSIKTVDTHRTNLMNQLDIHDLAGLVRYAARQGLISVND
jgi:DNA-binding NarL/FixJ family response regulator